MAEWDARAQRIAGLLGDRYELLELLGKGGFGAVYKVRNLRLRRVEALKVLSISPTEEEDFSKRFEQEARVAASLDHPNIVKIYDYGGEGDLFWFSMQFIDGPTLRRQLNERGRIEPVRAARIAVALLDALGYSHGRGVIHRDIKPENVLLDASRRPYLMDFGIAKSQDSAVKTQAGFILGSPAYMSPEQIKSETLDGRTDLYSLGITLYVMLSGELPFTAEDTFHAAMKKLSESPAPLEKVSGISPELEEIVMRAIAPEREERFATAGEMREAIGLFLDTAGLQDRTPTAPFRFSAILAAEVKTPAVTAPPRPDLTSATPLPREALTPPAIAAGAVTPPALGIARHSVAGRNRVLIFLLIGGVAAATAFFLWFSRPRQEQVARLPPVAASPPPAPTAAPLTPAPAAGLAVTEVSPALSPAPTQPDAIPMPRVSPAAPTPLPRAERRRTVVPAREPTAPPLARPEPSPPPSPVPLEGAKEEATPAGDPPPGYSRPRAAKFLPEPDPRYPIEVPVEIAKQHARESVGLMVTVAEDGTVKSAKVISEVCPECDYAALQAVRKARFKPARDAEGRPVEATFAFSVRF